MNAFTLIKIFNMTNTTDINIDDETIARVGLIPADEPINTQLSPAARVFKYPHLDRVYIMESDLYGNIMPKDSCFLAYYGRNGLMGQHLKIETLRNSGVEDIKALVRKNAQG